MPGDERGHTTDVCDGKTDTNYDDLLDTLAAVCATDDTAVVAIRV